MYRMAHNLILMSSKAWVSYMPHAFCVKLDCWFLAVIVFVNVKSHAFAKLCASLFSHEEWKLEDQLIIASMDATPVFHSSDICVRPYSQFCSGWHGTKSTCKAMCLVILWHTEELQGPAHCCKHECHLHTIDCELPSTVSCGSMIAFYCWNPQVFLLSW